MSTVPFTFGDDTGNVPLNRLDVNFSNVKAFANTAGFVTSNAQPNITSVGDLTSLYVSGGIDAGGRFSVVGNINSAGNIHGIYFLGNGTQLDGVNLYTNSNVAAYLPTYTGNLVSLTGPVTTTGNLTGSNLSISQNAIIYGNLQVQGTTTSVNSATLTTNNLTITVGNNQSTGSALNGAGLLIGSSNIAAWTYNNSFVAWQSNVAIIPSANSTVNLGNVSRHWNNLYANNLVGSNLTLSGDFAVSGTITTALNASGNVTGANITASGLMLATGNITGGNLRTSGSVSAVGTVTGGNLATGGSISATSTISGDVMQAATTLQINTWTVTEIGGSLYFQRSGANIAKLDTSGNFTAIGNIVAFGSL
jgi:cytoskeletal protein CcmA (bactofilin family)